MEIDVTKNMETFKSICHEKIKREGIDKLISDLEASTDFFNAPASSRFHLSCPGGLVQHSLNVYNCLIAKRQSPFWKNILENISDETLALVALFHDLCKANTYIQSTRNVKTYDPDDVAAAKADGQYPKQDSQGTFVWKTVPTYETDEKLPYGHGEKSVILLQQYLKLNKHEIYAIRWHMGFSEPSENYRYLNAAIKNEPLIVAIHEADMEASNIMEIDS